MIRLPSISTLILYSSLYHSPLTIMTSLSCIHVSPRSSAVLRHLPLFPTFLSFLLLRPPTLPSFPFPSSLPPPLSSITSLYCFPFFPPSPSFLQPVPLLLSLFPSVVFFPPSLTSIAFLSSLPLPLSSITSFFCFPFSPPSSEQHTH